MCRSTGIYKILSEIFLLNTSIDTINDYINTEKIRFNIVIRFYMPLKIMNVHTGLNGSGTIHKQRCKMNIVLRTENNQKEFIFVFHQWSLYA